MSALKKLKPVGKRVSLQRQRVFGSSFSPNTRVTPASGPDGARQVAGTRVLEPAIHVDASEVQVIRRGHLPNWFRESLQKDIERLEAAEREHGAAYTGY